MIFCCLFRVNLAINAMHQSLLKVRTRMRAMIRKRGLRLAVIRRSIRHLLANTRPKSRTITKPIMAATQIIVANAFAMAILAGVKGAMELVAMAAQLTIGIDVILESINYQIRNERRNDRNT